MATPWQLVITSLDGTTGPREASVEADNWLAALRSGRRELGEDGGVPQGASCTMSAAGDVTIVDAKTRLRYELRKLTTGATTPKVKAPAAASEAPQAPAPVVTSPVPQPAPQPSAPAPVQRPAPAQKRSATVAYSPEEAARIRSALMASAQGSKPSVQIAPAPRMTSAPPAAPQTEPQAVAPPSSQPPPQLAPAAPAPAAPAPAAPAVATAATDSQPPVAMLHNPFGAHPSQPPPAAPTPSRPPSGSVPPSASVVPEPEAASPLPPPPTAALGTPPAKLAAAAGMPERSPAAPVSPGPPKQRRAATVAYMQSPLASPAPRASAPEPQAAPPPTAPEPPRTPVEPPAAQEPPPVEASGTAADQPAVTEDAPVVPAARVSVPSSERNPVSQPPLAPVPGADAMADTLPSHPKPVVPGQRKSSLPATGEDGPVLLHSRDEDPTEERPLVYRERAFVVDPQTDEVACEWLLREQLAKLRAGLDPSRTGNFISIALFDHKWTKRPSGPPLATLQWKDWRGEPEIKIAKAANANWRAPSQVPARFSSMPPVVVPAAPAAPAAPVVPAAPAAPAAPVAPAAPAAPVAPAATSPVATPMPPAPQTPTTAPDPLISELAPSAPPHPPADDTGEHDRRLAYAFEAAQDLYFLETPGEGVTFIAQLLQELVPSELARGTLYDIDSDELRVVANVGEGIEADHAPLALPANAGLFSIAIASGLTVWISLDLAADPRFKADIDGIAGLEPRNALYLVLRYRETLLGVLQLVNRKDARGFSDSDKAIATYAAEQLGNYLRERRGLRRRK